MPDPSQTRFLASARVAPEVFALRPDYRVLLMAADGIEPGPSAPDDEKLMVAAEDAAAQTLADRPFTEVPHVAAWREAYRAFGAKPQRTRNSLEALMRRAATGLPRVNRLTDAYNAISVLHQVPLGGEDLACYQGAPQLIRATGAEPFDTIADGAPVVENPDPGEVVWCDDAGVTCRRWNWRQGRRTALTDTTTSAVFILDALDPMSDDALRAAADGLAKELERLGSNVTVASRVISAA
ncbi:DNA/RNA-binding domain of Phe-tRNA-synthetase-like protein [Haloactinopolyspora alba]|uniref:DNA/RNA-binding domain of Phe-tRNA-synthetase-like protein n=1 Tax=Haloactinopolyspora alba TaxID=648780 RepID=A0A2P8EBG6_9ACTN|nr:phenylalanine--tRNA ligase beta subunit-related protein [Haloactinopolyspora alba]PSL06814.1 DNA/RNA-binding domain of Phe-tRNA-synthetase-like protein [Haloactinopolyspora alba]